MSANERPPRKKYRLVIFDMDGTLTEELLDFSLIRREIAVPEDRGILEHIAELAPPQSAVARDILHRHEITAADQCRLHDGAADILHTLRRHAIRTALLTRNSAACTARVLERHPLPLDFVATRELLPHKPHAGSILNITGHFGIFPEQTLMVGDYLYDLQAAAAAGVDSALLWTKSPDWPHFAAMATYKLRQLRDVLALIDGVDSGALA